MNEDAPAPPPADDVPGPPPPPPFGAKRALQIFAAFLGTQLLVAIVVGLFAAGHKLPGAAVGPGAPVVDPRLALGAALLGTLLGGLVAARMLARTFAQAGGEAARVAVGWRGATARACVAASLQGLVLVAAFAVAVGLMSGLHHDLGPLARAAQAGGGARAAWAVLAVALAPPIEELVFRGVLYAGFARRWGPRVAGVVTTLLFVALHVTEIGAFVPAWLIIGTLGALTLRARLRSGSLLPAIALHASYNLGLVLLAGAR